MMNLEQKMQRWLDANGVSALPEGTDLGEEAWLIDQALRQLKSMRELLNQEVG